jgi:hypothetical protein
VVVVRLGQPKLDEDAVDVLLDGAFGDPQAARDACVRPAFSHEREHLALA